MLRSNHKRLLQANEKEIYDSYKNFSVDCLFCQFQEGRPTLKDVSSLIAMSIRAAREADRLIQTNLDKENLDAWLVHYNISPILARVRTETAAEKLDAAIYRVFRANAPLLLESYITHYMTPELAVPDTSSATEP